MASLSEISHPEKDNYCMISLTCGFQKAERVETKSRMAVAGGWVSEESRKGWPKGKHLLVEDGLVLEIQRTAL